MYEEGSGDEAPAMLCCYQTKKNIGINNFCWGGGGVNTLQEKTEIMCAILIHVIN